MWPFNKKSVPETEVPTPLVQRRIRCSDAYPKLTEKSYDKFCDICVEIDHIGRLGGAKSVSWILLQLILRLEERIAELEKNNQGS